MKPIYFLLLLAVLLSQSAQSYTVVTSSDFKEDTVFYLDFMGEFPAHIPARRHLNTPTPRNNEEFFAIQENEMRKQMPISKSIPIYRKSWCQNKWLSRMCEKKQIGFMMVNCDPEYSFGGEEKKICSGELTEKFK